MDLVDDIFPIRVSVDDMIDAWDNLGFKYEQTEKEKRWLEQTSKSVAN